MCMFKSVSWGGKDSTMNKAHTFHSAYLSSISGTTPGFLNIAKSSPKHRVRRESRTALGVLSKLNKNKINCSILITLGHLSSLRDLWTQ